MQRAIGISARYCSGYLHTKPGAKLGEKVAGESHAGVGGGSSPESVSPLWMFRWN
ncbi:hypothetical protein [Amycolatopsis circi]|uniref:hypothetical protein n=1 Tax=Amycolatopsis circi TaxID=871959 RepID=UPI001FCA2A40|nr:hypothetical protein [Amycolatopsis circi]